MHTTNNAERIDRAFVKLLDDLTERQIITWRREGNELRANIELVLEVQDIPERDGDPDSDCLRTLIVDGGNPDTHCILPVPFELLTDQFAEIDPADNAPDNRTMSADAGGAAAN